jgi:hypothetical protein
MRLSYKIGLGVLIGFILILAGFWISPFGQFIRSFDYDEDRDKFDKEAWAINWTKYTYDENGRHFMLEDLKDNYLQVGMDSIAVKNLLGEPERDFGFSYNLGFYQSGFDPTFLILDFDEEGKLKEIKIETI